jgi:predicted alpha/beta hydrolase family esterase
MRTSEADILLIPGMGDSGEGHWQSRWEAKLPTARRVVQMDWHRPRFQAWINNIRTAVDEAQRPVVIVAHSLGVTAAIHATYNTAGKIAGGFFVAPPSKASIKVIEAIDPAFAAEPAGVLSYPSIIVASRDDPFSDYAESEGLAQQIGAGLADAGNSGHINMESGHGPWPEGLLRFAGFMKSL